MIRDYCKGKESDRRYALEKAFRQGFGKVLVVGSYCYEPVVINSTHACDLAASSEESLRKNGWKGEFKVADVRNLPYNDKEFDCVFCCEVLEHLEDSKDIKKAISEISRVGKTWFISVPYQNKIPSPSHKTIFDRRLLSSLLPFTSKIIVKEPFMYASNDIKRLIETCK